METAEIRRETLILSAGVVFLLDPVLLSFFSALALPKLIGLGFTRILETAGIIAIVLFFQKNLSPIGFIKGEAASGIKKGFLWSAATGALTLSVFLALYFSGINPVKLFRAPVPNSSFDMACYFITGGIIAPVAEEVFFRGVLYRFLRSWGFTFALAVSTSIFAAFHVLFGGSRMLPLTQILGGVLFAVSLEKGKSLWVPIIIHATGNIAIFSLSLL
jgi:membrane protease YdiL (CAAX protease family)